MQRSVAEPGELTRLLETEQRLEEALRVTRSRADALLAEAVQAARSREAGVDATLAAADQASRSELAAERRRREREIAAAADRTIDSYEAVDDAQVVALARQLVARLLAGWTS